MLDKKSKNKKVNLKGEDLKAQLARALADYDNLVKRTEAEKALWVSFAKKELLVKLLPVIDALETAQKHLSDSGLDLVLDQIKKIFTDEGIVEIEASGQFDPDLHEAVDTLPGGNKNQIAEVLQKGYKFAEGDVIRHARVRVYAGEVKN